jgi:hypothetical protein
VLAKTNKAKKERKNREKQRNHQGEVVDKQTHKRKKNSMFRNNRISVLIVVVLLFQHPVLVSILSRSSVLPGG